MKKVSKTIKVSQTRIYFVNDENGVSDYERTIYGTVNSKKVKEAFGGDNKIVHYNVEGTTMETYEIPLTLFLKESEVVDERVNNKEYINRTMINTHCTAFKIIESKPVSVEIELPGKLTEKDIKKVQRDYPDIVYITNCRNVEENRCIELNRFIYLAETYPVYNKALETINNEECFKENGANK